MNRKFLLPTLVMIVLSSCTSRYKTTQTPDDLYYSPATVLEEEKPQTNNTATASDNSYNGTGYYDSYFLRHKVRNRYLWNNIDDYSYWNDTRYNHCPSNWSYYNNYYGYNSYYSGWNNYYSYGYNGYNSGYYNPYFNPYFNYGYYGNGWNNNNYFNNHNNYNPGPTKTSAYSNVKTYYNQNYNNTNYSTNTQTGATQGTNITNDKKVSRTKSSSNGDTWSAPVRTLSNPSTPSSNTGGSSGGFNSSGSSSSKPRAGRG